MAGKFEDTGGITPINPIESALRPAAKTVPGNPLTDFILNARNVGNAATTRS